MVEKDAPLFTVDTLEGEPIEIQSPNRGLVLAQYQKPGEAVSTISSIVTVADLGILRANFNVYEKDLASIKLGQKIIVKTIAYPDKEFEGQIVFVSPQIDPSTRAIKIRADVKNPEYLLRFGMFVTGMVLNTTSGEALVIPEEAAQEVNGQAVVFVPGPQDQGDFLIKPVKTGRKIGGQIEVLEGLQEAESVVGKGSFYVKAELLKGSLEEDEESGSERK
jgi:cobalt-zinc-cadmium efflux system membrane fusion protein